MFFFQKQIEIRKLETELKENVIFAIYQQYIDELWPVSKWMFANLVTVLSSTFSHYRCAASLILMSTVPGGTRVTIGIGQNESGHLLT